MLLMSGMMKLAKLFSFSSCAHTGVPLLTCCTHWLCCRGHHAAEEYLFLPAEVVLPVMDQLLHREKGFSA